MKETPLGKLQRATAEVSEKQSRADKINDLSKALEQFSQDTARLDSTYQTLSEELEAKNAYLRCILESMAQGLIFINSDGQITTYNRAATQFLGNGDALFRTFWETFPDEIFGFSIKKALVDGEFPTIVEISLSDGDQILEVEITHVDSAGLLILIRDITEIDALERQARHNDHMQELGHLASMIAHEVRNPLGGIRGFACLLKDDLKESPKQQEMVKNIIQGADDLNRLVDDFLQFARKEIVNKQPIHVASIFEEIKAGFLADAKYQTKFQMDIEAAEIFIDPALFKSIILNLLQNSAEAMNGKGVVTLKCSNGKRRAHIAISDTGSGIKPADMEQIFQPFFTTKAKGTGLGLAEVKRATEAMGGTIELKSQENIGTTFTLKFERKLS